MTSRPLRRQPQENPMNIKQLITAALIASAAFATQAAPQKPVSAAQTAQHSAVWIDVRSEQEFS
ncbi:rhodanese-like domain-containing protein, partial [Neisseria gonorrhoeae]